MQQEEFSRQDVLNLINRSGLPSHLGQLQKAVLASATEMILGNTAEADEDAKLSTKERRNKQDNEILGMVGPAAASSAVEYAINACRKQNLLRNINFNGSYTHNVQLVQNDIGDSPNFSNTVRQFLLPRYAYLNFDLIIDPRHRIDTECGYPKWITPIMYRYMYDRDDVARRVVDVYPNESWAVDPRVYETDDEDEGAPDTPFEAKWKELCQDHNLMSVMYRMDRLCGIGHYGVLLLGLSGEDGNDLEKPINESELLKGTRNSVGTKQRELLYLRPFDEYLSFIQQYEMNVNSPRYGMPIYYNLVFIDMTIDAAGASIGTRINQRVHWTRVLHVSDNLMSSLVFGIPRQQPVFNRELDLRKLKGGGAEMFWKGAFPGISFELDPKFVADNPDFDKDDAKNQVDQYFSGLNRALFLQGIKANSLAPKIATSPEKYVDIQMRAISSSLEMPMRIFMGSEEGRLASSQDVQTWNKRLGRRCRLFLAPCIVRNLIDRLIAVGVMPPPTKKTYLVDWPDLDSPTDEDKANLALKWSQAMSQYVASGMVHLISPMDYLTIIMGLRPSYAKRIVDAIDKNGGMSKLRAVDPDQGAAQNGVRKNTTDSESTKKSAKKRNKSTKRNEGLSS